MALAMIAAAAAGLIFKGGRFGLGVIFGGLLAFGNFAWLDRSTKAVFTRTSQGLGPGLPALSYIFRYVVVGGALLVVYLTDAFPVAAVIIGLSAFVAAVVADGFYRIFNTKV